MAENFGWIEDQEAIEEVLQTCEFDSFAATPAAEFSDIPNLIQPWVLNKLPARNQGKVGSCTAHATSRCLEYLQLVEINAGDQEEYNPLSREVIYGLARVQVAKGRWKNQDGATGATISQAVKEYGNIDEKTVGNYDVERCKLYGSAGCPAEYLPMCANHKCDIVRVLSVDSALKSLAQGYFINICSAQGFELSRNSEGIAKPSSTPWLHSMACIGAKKLGKNWIFALENSWGEQSTKGPISDLPHAGCFYIDQDVLGKMLERKDSWAYSSFNGFVKKQIQWRF